MSGNLCRCTGYVGIVDAIERVMARACRARGPADRRSPRAGSARRRGRKPWQAEAQGARRAPRFGSPAPKRRRRETWLPPILRAPARRRSAAASRSRSASRRSGAGATRLTQSFVLAHPREAVWRLMADAEAVARCMPGMSLDGPLDGRQCRAGGWRSRSARSRRASPAKGTVASFPPNTARSSRAAAATARAARAPRASVDYRLRPGAGPTGERGHARRRRDQLRAHRPACPVRPLRPRARPRPRIGEGLRAKPRRRALGARRSRDRAGSPQRLLARLRCAHGAPLRKTLHIRSDPLNPRGHRRACASALRPCASASNPGPAPRQSPHRTRRRAHWRRERTNARGRSRARALPPRRPA